MIAAHFGEWLQGRLGPEGPLVLVTLPFPFRAVQVGRTGAEHRDVAPHRARFFEALNVADPGTPLSALLPPGAGCGVSTAALVALGQDAGVTDPDRLARTCLVAEGAVDPLMWNDADTRLWAPRSATTLRRVPPVEAAEIVGGFFGPPLPTDPQDLEFPDIADLVEAWTRGVPLRDRARLAGESAARTTCLRGPHDDPAATLAVELGALGHARAHTGSARAFIFAPGSVPDDAEAQLREAGLSDPVRFRTGCAR